MNGTRQNIRHVVAMFTKHPCLFISGVLVVLAVSCTWYSRGDDLSLFPPQRPLFPHNSNIHEIPNGSLDTLSTFIDDSTLKFVLYYAPWCGQSRKAIPEFIRVANILHSEVTFIAINCWLGSCQKEYRLEYFPQLVAYHTSFPGVQYPEANDVLSLYMIRFLQDILRPFTHLGREQELQEVQAINQEVVLSYIDNINNKEYRRFFGAALEYVGKVSRPFFGLVTNFNIANKLGLNISGQLSFYRVLDSTSVFHPKANNSIQNITNWISLHRKEIITELTPKPSNRDFLKTQLNEKPAVILFLPVRQHKISTSLLKTYTRIATDYSNCTCGNMTRHKLRNLTSRDALPIPVNPDDIRPSSTQRSTQDNAIKTYVSCGSFVIKDEKYNNVCDICQSYVKRCCHGDFMDIYHRLRRHIPFTIATPCRSLRLFYYPMVRASVCCRDVVRTDKYGYYKERLKKKMQFATDTLLQKKIDNFIDSFYDKVIKALDPLQEDIEGDALDYEVSGLEATPHLSRRSVAPAVSTASGNNTIAKENSFLATSELSSNTTSDGCNRTGHVTRFQGASCHSNRSVNFFYMDSERFWSVAERLGVNASEVKNRVCLVVVDVKNEAYYLMKEDRPVTNHTIVEFVMEFMNAKLQRSLRSADTPSAACPESQACVVEVTSATLDGTVMDKNKDVLLVYYAPWCGFCINLAPVLLTVARFFKDFNNVLIARIDADQNDLPWQHTVTSYPTIILYPARRKDFSVRFPNESERTAAALIKFILQHGTEAAIHTLYGKADSFDTDVIKNKLNQLESCLHRAEEEKKFLETRLEGLVMEKSLLEVKQLKLLKGFHEAQKVADAERDIRVSLKTKVEQAEDSRRKTDDKNLVLALRNIQLESKVSKLEGELQEGREKSQESIHQVQRLATLKQEMEEMNELVVKERNIAEKILSHLRKRDRILSSKVRRLQSTRNSLHIRLTQTNMENMENKKLIKELRLEKRMLASLLKDAEITMEGLKASLASSEKRLGDDGERLSTAVKKHQEANDKLQEMRVNYEKLTVILSQIDIPKKHQLK